MKDFPNKWKVGQQLGIGTFSSVFSAVDPATSTEVAIKYSLSSTSSRLLENECEAMRDLRDCKCTPHTGVPQLIDASNCRKYIVMEKVGKSLLQLHSGLQAFSLKTVILVALQGITALEELHSCGYVHRDLKPDNIAINLDPTNPALYLIDVGLSFRFQHCGMHVPYSERQDFQGTPFFCSDNSLRGVKSARRDDMESFGYVLLFLLKGDLPWFSTPFKSPHDVHKILARRTSISVAQLCHGCDEVFAGLITYAKGLAFKEKPDYVRLRQQFISAAIRLGIDVDWVYDWTPKASKPRFCIRLVRTTSIISARTPLGRHKSHRVLSTHLHSNTPSPHPGEKMKALRLPTASEVSRTISPGSDNDLVDEDDTPKLRVEQLPKFRWPRSAGVSFDERVAELNNQS